ncbi:hypothetical protein pb186bvf_014384 [Paramecium bursaria]
MQRSLSPNQNVIEEDKRLLQNLKEENRLLKDRIKIKLQELQNLQYLMSQR